MPTLRLMTLSALTFLALGVGGCSSVRSLMTGLPPKVEVNQTAGFDPAKATSAAVVVVIGSNQGVGIYGVPTERGVLVRAVNDAVEAKLMAKGYTVPTGKSIPLVLAHKGDPSAMDAVAIAKQLGVDLAFIVAVHELRETEQVSGGERMYDQVFNVTAQGVGVASGRTGWTGSAQGTAHVDKGSLQRVVVEVATAIAERFPSKTGTAVSAEK